MSLLIPHTGNINDVMMGVVVVDVTAVKLGCIFKFINTEMSPICDL